MSHLTGILCTEQHATTYFIEQVYALGKYFLRAVDSLCPNALFPQISKIWREALSIQLRPFLQSACATISVVISRRDLIIQGDATPGVVRENGRVVYVDISQRASEMGRRQELAAARRLLHSQLPLEPRNGALWAQLGNLERRLAKREGGRKLHNTSYF